MTPKIIELKQAPVVLVELPEKENIGELELRFDHPLMGGNHKANLLNNKRFIGVIGFANDFDENSVIGILSDLTEDQFAECVETTNQSNGTLYQMYTYDRVNNLSHATDLAKHSFQSLLESEKVYTESQASPDMYDPKYYDEPYDGPGFYQEIYSSDIVDWKEAQSRTINPERTVVLLKNKS